MTVSALCVLGGEEMRREEGRRLFCAKGTSGLGISIHPHLASYPPLSLSPLLLQTSPLQYPAPYTQEGGMRRVLFLLGSHPHLGP